ncbi:MAG: acyltransferase family protein [Thermoguttaceae bacterium]
MQNMDQKGKPAQGVAARLTTVDMLRGMAALAVVMYHARGLLWCGTSCLLSETGLHASFNAWAGYLLSIFSFGWLGVPLFFVLSGYCIHRSYARRLKADSAAPIDWREYAFRRLWRIYPVYLAALVLTAATDSYLRAYAPAWHSAGDDRSLFSFASSVLSLQCITAPVFGSNHVFWTLSLELHFYAVYPLLLLISRRSPRGALLAALAVSLAYIVVDQMLGIGEMFPYRCRIGSPVFPTYWAVWAVGMYLADVEAGRDRIPSWAIWLWLPAGVLGLVIKSRGIADFDWLCWGWFFAGLLFTLNQPRVSKYCHGRLCQVFSAVGVFSYSLYATHLCILRLVGAFMVNPESKPISLLPMFIAVVFSVAFAWIFFQCVERWSLRVPGASALRVRAKPAECVVVVPCSVVSPDTCLPLQLSAVDDPKSA